MIPTSYIGNNHAAKKFIGLGRKLLGDLRTSLSFQNLPTGKTFYKFSDGTTIECVISYGLSEVRINVPTGKLLPRKYIEEYCPCYPHFTIGEVVAVTPESPTLEWLETGRFEYNIEVCDSRNYILLESVKDMNFGRYYIGQLVIVTIFDGVDAWDYPYDCNRSCLLEIPQFLVYGLAPIHITGAMNKWKEEEVGV